jgi:hypothetical protein
VVDGGLADERADVGGRVGAVPDAQNDPSTDRTTRSGSGRFRKASTAASAHAAFTA